MRQKMYYVKLSFDTMFASEADLSDDDLKKDAVKFLQTELSENDEFYKTKVSVKLIDKESKIPKGWKDNGIWGTELDECEVYLKPKQFLKEISVERQRYNELKEKFKNVSHKEYEEFLLLEGQVEK